MQHLRTWCLNIRQLSGLKAHLTAGLAGLASVLSLAPVFAWPIMFLTLPILFLLIEGAVNRAAEGSLFDRAKKAGVIGWSFGFGYFFASLFWIGEAFLVEAEKFAWALPFAVSLLPAGLAVYFAVATAIAGIFWRPGVVPILTLALTLTLTEWLRGQLFTGFPWNLLGYTLTGNEGLMQWASVFGAYGLTPLAVMIYASPVLILNSPDNNRNTGRLTAGPVVFPAMAIAVLFTGMIFGYWRLASPNVAPVANVKLRLVQPNIPQKDKWRPDKRGEVFKRLLDLTRTASTPGDEGLNGVTHVIWPESAFPFLVLKSPEALNAIAELLPEKVTLLTGALRVVDTPVTPRAGKGQGPRQIFNSLLAIDAEGGTLSIYDKMHLVPFGEYLPFQHILEAIGLEQLTRLKGGFAGGAGPRVMRVPGLPSMVPLICYEIIFPDHVIVGAGHQKWLLNLTNDAWFGRTSGPYQHFHQARVRAIEEGLPVVRVANTGISAIIDPYGRITHEIPLLTTGAVNGILPMALDATVYTTYRGLIIPIEIIVLLILVFVVIRRSGTN